MGHKTAFGIADATGWVLANFSANAERALDAAGIRADTDSRENQARTLLARKNTFGRTITDARPN